MTEKMWAVVKSKRAPGAEIKKVDIPKIGDNEVLVKVRRTSICGTDVHIWEWDPWSQEEMKNIPIIFGHEATGEVVKVGSAVKSVKVGDLVSAETHIADGTCYQCRTGRMHICENMKILGVTVNGAFAEYFKIPEINAWKVDPNLEPEIASILEPLGNAVHTALPAGNYEDITGNTVLILGAGPIGLMSIVVAKYLGARKVIVTEFAEKKVRFELAKKMGADRVLDAKMDQKELEEIILSETDYEGPSVVFEMSGAPAALELGLKVITPGGRISLLGIFKGPVSINLNEYVIFKNLRVFGITGRRMFDTWYQVSGLLERPEFKKTLKQVITHIIPIKDIEKGIELIKTAQAAKVVMEPIWE
ncbi:MAG: L-threonine 3-dehydrogenase [Candidatus Asgardarchaeum californiense]|nr:MAG: L-threonine 3-dehydrogenase [Candidatus Asgardarchaeum californiense]